MAISKKKLANGVFPEKAKGDEPVMMFVKADDLNPNNRYVYGSVNGKVFQYETGRTHNMPYAEAEHLFYCNLAYPV